MSNQLNFKIRINSKTKGENENLCEWSTRKKCVCVCVCVCFLISEVVIIKKGEIVEAKLHGESKVTQRCFNDNNDDNKR